MFKANTSWMLMSSGKKNKKIIYTCYVDTSDIINNKKISW